MIIFLILLLLVIYSVVGSYDNPEPDDRSALVDNIYGPKAALLVPYDTLILKQGDSTNLRIAVLNTEYDDTEFHLGIGCVDQYRPQQMADFTLSHFPDHVIVDKGNVTVHSSAGGG